MQYLFFITISFLIGTGLGILMGLSWKIMKKTDSRISEVNILLREIKQEMKDIHNNVCPIEKRIRR